MTSQTLYLDNVTICEETLDIRRIPTMGNINCIPRRRDVSRWFRSRDKASRKRNDVTESHNAKEVCESQRRNVHPEINENGDIAKVDDRRDVESMQSDRPRTPFGVCAFEDEIVDPVDTSFSTKVLEEKETRSEETHTYDIRHETGDYDNTHDGEIDDQESLNSDRSLSSFGVCAFEDEIVDPAIDNLIVNSMEAGDGDDKEFEDEMEDIDSLNSERSLNSFGVCVYDDEMKPRVKAIERIKAYHDSLRWRKDPIPVEERRGSILDLSWSRHMRQVEKQVQRQTRMRSTIMARFPQTTHVSMGNRRSSTCTSTVTTILEEEEEEEEKEDDVPVSPTRQLRTHGFMASADDNVAMETERRDSGGLIRRHTSYFNLPCVD